MHELEEGAVSHRIRVAGLAATALALATVPFTGSFSSATFVQSSISTGTVSAAADWSSPTARVVVPTGRLRGIVELTATTADSGSGVANVKFQYRAVGETHWRQICTDPAAPYTCTWDTRSVPDGAYDFRVSVNHKSDNTTTSPLVRTQVDNRGAITSVPPTQDSTNDGNS